MRVTFSVLDRPSTTDAEALIIDQILTILEERRGERSYKDLALEIGISRPMLRMMDLNGAIPGIDTLSILIDWDEQTFGPLVLEYMKHRGSILRSRTTRAD